MKRRDFLKTTTAAIAAGITLPSSAEYFSTGKKPIGLQLYSVREDLTKDLNGTLRKLADIGFSHLEAAGYRNDRLFYQQKPGVFKKMIEDLGMAFTGSHTGSGLLPPEDSGWDFWKAAMEDHVTAGTRWIVQSYYTEAEIKTLDQVKRLADQFNRIGNMAKQAGLRFAYHNHVTEFIPIEGLIPYDILIESTDPALVTFQLDTSQMIIAGYACEKYIRQYPGRFANWHLKDPHKTEDVSTEFGKGRLNFESLFALRDLAGLEDYYIEQEVYTMTPLEAVRHDYEFLMKAPYVQ